MHSHHVMALHCPPIGPRPRIRVNHFNYWANWLLVQLHFTLSITKYLNFDVLIHFIYSKSPRIPKSPKESQRIPKLKRYLQKNSKNPRKILKNPEESRKISKNVKESQFQGIPLKNQLISLRSQRIPTNPEKSQKMSKNPKETSRDP